MAENTPLSSLLARRWAVEVAPIGSTDFVRVRGINSLTPGLDSTLEDDTDYENDGWSSSEKTLMGWSLSLGFIEKVGTEDRAPDPGQQVIENASDKFGADGQLNVRWFERLDEGETSTEGKKAYQGIATVQYEPQGGAPSALSTVNTTLQGKGKRERIDHPLEGGSGN